LASLLAMRPQHLVLDEPVAGLDPAGRQSIEAVIAQTALEISVVLLTADLPLALRLADRLVLLEQGEIVFDGLPSEAIGDRKLVERLSLLVPVQVELLDALQRAGFPGRASGNLRPASVVRMVAATLRAERMAEPC
jgi:ABC-type multidrug transport system ATPase subunit